MTFSYPGITRLIVEGVYFQIDIVGHDGDVVESEIEMPESLRKLGVAVLHEISGSDLRVWVKRPIPLPGTVKKCRMVFRVPEKADIEGETSSGSIHVRRSNGNKKIHTTSGRICVADSAGGIVGGSTSGGQTYERTVGFITAESTSGSIETAETEGALALKSTSGRLAGSAVYLTGDSSFQTTSGSIEFDFTNEPGDLAFDLSSASGGISAGGSRSRGRLTVGTGEIRVIGKSASGRQKYR